MIGLVLVTHGMLAKEFVHAMEHVIGTQEKVVAICIGPDDDMEQRRQDILDAVKQVETGAGVIVLTDMFGGTPSNLAISIMDRAKVEVLVGLNLPMLIKLGSVRHKETLDTAVRSAKKSGRDYIKFASEVYEPPKS